MGILDIMMRGAVYEIRDPFKEVITSAEDVVRHLKAIQLKGVLELLRLQLGYSNLRSGITLHGNVPDRDTGQIVDMIGYGYLQIPKCRRDFLVEVRNGLVSAMAHEVDEGFLFLGDRIFDPHDSSKMLPPVVFSR